MRKSVYISYRYMVSGDGKTKYLRITYRPHIVVGGKKVGSEVFRGLWLYVQPNGKGEQAHNKGMQVRIDRMIDSKRYDYDISLAMPVCRASGGTLLEALDYVIENDTCTKSTKKCKRTVYNIVKGYLYNNGLAQQKVKDILREDDTFHMLSIISTIDKTDKSDSSKSVYKFNFKSLLADLYRHSILNYDLSKKLKLKVFRAPIKEPLTVDEMGQLRATDCGLSEVKDVAMFSYYTGLRVSDILPLTYENFSTDGSSGTEKWYLRTKVLKTQKQYYARLDRRAVEIVKALDTKSTDKKAKVFRRVFYNIKFKNALAQWTKAAGIERRVTMHVFRHTFASHMYDKGVDIYGISELLGHSNLSVTATYLSNLKPMESHIELIEEDEETGTRTSREVIGERSTLLTDYISLN